MISTSPTSDSTPAGRRIRPLAATSPTPRVVYMVSREVEVVERPALELAADRAEAGAEMHQPVAAGEQRDLGEVGEEGGADDDEDAPARRDRHALGEPRGVEQRLVVHEHDADDERDGGDKGDQRVHAGRQRAWLGCPVNRPPQACNGAEDGRPGHQGMWAASVEDRSAAMLPWISSGSLVAAGLAGAVGLGCGVALGRTNYPPLEMLLQGSKTVLGRIASPAGEPVVTAAIVTMSGAGAGWHAHEAPLFAGCSRAS